MRGAGGRVRRRTQERGRAPGGANAATELSWQQTEIRPTAAATGRDGSAHRRQPRHSARTPPARRGAVAGRRAGPGAVRTALPAVPGAAGGARCGSVRGAERL